MTSIIIPAHNEEFYISKCLEPLLEYTSKYHELQIIVICNNCIDNTVSIVKSFEPIVICIDTDIASKTNAINEGEKIANSYPRIYLDADIILNINSIEAIIKLFSNKNCLAGSVEAKMDFSNSSFFVKAFYDIWLSLPYCKAGMIGSGIYALSEKGRSRFGEFPDIIADDGYVRCLFNENERMITKGNFSLVTAPYDLFSLIKIKTRSRLGRYQLKDKFPNLLVNETKDYQGVVKRHLFNFTLWPKLIIYLGVNTVSRLRAKYQYLTKQTKWERDDSNRSKKNKKALFISSCGGHWKQMRRLEPAFEGVIKYYASTDSGYAQFVPNEIFYSLPDASMWNKFRLIWQAVSVLWLLIKTRPDVVITTGASVGFFALFFAKKLNIKTIWLDSLANAENMSLSGIKVRPYADLWLTQWEHLAKPKGPHFYGAVL
ncbi:MAG: glycosyltransferase [Methylococcales bacterium]|nr:glycosyltransferase [Methylococcales bacterium]